MKEIIFDQVTLDGEIGQGYNFESSFGRVEAINFLRRNSSYVFLEEDAKNIHSLSIMKELVSIGLFQFSSSHALFPDEGERPLDPVDLLSPEAKRDARRIIERLFEQLD